MIRDRNGHSNYQKVKKQVTAEYQYTQISVFKSKALQFLATTRCITICEFAVVMALVVMYV